MCKKFTYLISELNKNKFFIYLLLKIIIIFNFKNKYFL